MDVDTFLLAFGSIGVVSWFIFELVEVINRKKNKEKMTYDVATLQLELTDQRKRFEETIAQLRYWQSEESKKQQQIDHDKNIRFNTLDEYIDRFNKEWESDTSCEYWPDFAEKIANEMKEDYDNEDYE